MVMMKNLESDCERSEPNKNSTETQQRVRESGTCSLQYNSWIVSTSAAGQETSSTQKLNSRCVKLVHAAYSSRTVSASAASRRNI